MRQAGWNEIFVQRYQPTGIVPDVPEEPRGWRRLLWWEDLLTFGLLTAVLATVVLSIQRAGWVDEMPPLFPIALLGLLMGALLARLRWPEAFVHLLALPVGAAAILGQLIGIMSGPTPWDRYRELHARMGEWFHAAFTGGISNDELPFVLLVVYLCWLVSYIAGWSVFRWRNAWLALLPAGGALAANFAYQSGQFSLALAFFVLGGTLLISRVYLLDQARSWRDERTPYPGLISLTALHATFWIALFLLGAAWLLPRADESSGLESVWERATAPVEERIDSVSRLFVSIDAKKPVRIHRFEDLVPFLGAIDLPDTPVVEVIAEGSGDPQFLRAQAYYVYTPQGWEVGSQQQSELEANAETLVDLDVQHRDAVSIEVIARSSGTNSILTIGQPQRVNRAATYQWWRARSDITGLEATANLASGQRYESTGSVSIATEAVLRDAGNEYPGWVLSRYLGFGTQPPDRVQALADQLTASEATPYDKALAIQSYLRSIPYDLDVPTAPRGRDPIDFFLFDVRSGYFDYHASAMVVLLRSVGIPSRLAVGYVLEPSEEEGTTYRFEVTEADAYAWPEVYFPGLGWVEFNPTPNQPAIARPGGAGAGPVTLPTGDAPAVDLGIGGIANAFPDESTGATGTALSPGEGSDAGRWIIIGLASTIVAAVLVGASAASFAWLRGLATLPEPARLWEQTVRLASWTRLPAIGSSTPHEYARALADQVPDAFGAPALADAYVRHSFGAQEISQAELDGLESAWRSVRGALLRRLWPLS